MELRGPRLCQSPACESSALEAWPIVCMIGRAPSPDAAPTKTKRDGSRMEVFVQQLINGLTLGSIYGLIAIGYTMVFGIIGMINFAHGDVFMVSAFIALIFFLILTSWLGIASP